MKSFGTIGTTAVFLLLGLAVPAHARQEKQEEKASPPKQEQQAKPEKQEQAKPEKQQQAKPQQQQKQQQQEAKSEKQEQQQAKGQQKQQQEQAKSNKEQAKSEKQQQQQAKGQQKQQQEQAKSNKQEAKSEKQQQPHQQQAKFSKGPQRTQEEEARQRSQPALRLSARGGGRIPDDRFRSHFGREHRFHIGEPVMVDGYSRFQYGGFWFGFVDPWPVGWYYTDDVYIDYVDGGYYMYNPYYPGARFAITVVM